MNTTTKYNYTSYYTNCTTDSFSDTCIHNCCMVYEGGLTEKASICTASTIISTNNSLFNYCSFYQQNN